MTASLHMHPLTMDSMSTATLVPPHQLVSDALLSAAALRKLRNGIIDTSGKLHLRTASTVLEALAALVQQQQQDLLSLYDGQQELRHERSLLQLSVGDRELQVTRVTRRISLTVPYFTRPTD